MLASSFLPASALGISEGERRPHVIVAGLARCGTTMTMGMLHAGGVPCIGEYPAFEVDGANHRPIEMEFLARYPGHALKLLDPHLTPLPAKMPPGILIWLDRDESEQAKSQAKFVSITMGVPTVSRSNLRRWAAGLRRDRAPALAPFAGWRKLMLRFEQIVEFPRIAALTISNNLAPWWTLDCDRMAASVIPRSAKCQPGIDIELSLMDRADSLPPPRRSTDI